METGAVCAFPLRRLGKLAQQDSCRRQAGRNLCLFGIQGGSCLQPSQLPTHRHALLRWLGLQRKRLFQRAASRVGVRVSSVADRQEGLAFFLDLCAGPGAWSEWLLFRCSQLQLSSPRPWKVHGFGVSLTEDELALLGETKKWTFTSFLSTSPLYTSVTRKADRFFSVAISSAAILMPLCLFAVYAAVASQNGSGNLYDPNAAEEIVFQIQGKAAALRGKAFALGGGPRKEDGLKRLPSEFEPTSPSTREDTLPADSSREVSPLRVQSVATASSPEASNAAALSAEEGWVSLVVADGGVSVRRSNPTSQTHSPTQRPLSADSIPAGLYRQAVCAGMRSQDGRRRLSRVLSRASLRPPAAGATRRRASSPPARRLPRRLAL